MIRLNHSSRLFLAALLAIIAQGSYAAQKNEKPQIISLADSPKITFSIPAGSRATFTFLPSRYTENYAQLLGNLLLKDEDCNTGHQGVITYRKTDRENLFAYFAKEIPWGSTATLTINRDNKTNELSLTLNDETLKIQPKGRINFMKIESVPQPLKIDAIEPTLQ